MFQKSV